MAINIYNHNNLFPILGTGKPILLIKAGDHRIWPPYRGGATSMDSGSATSSFLGAYYTQTSINKIVADDYGVWVPYADTEGPLGYYYRAYNTYNTFSDRKIYYKAYVKYTSSYPVTFNVTMFNRFDHSVLPYISTSTGASGTNVKKMWSGYVSTETWSTPYTLYILPPAPTTTGVYIAYSAMVISTIDMS